MHCPHVLPGYCCSARHPLSPAPFPNQTNPGQGHLSERDAAYVMRQLLEFLAFAHDECNVVHRDIKPENLLLLDVDAPQSLARVEAIRAAGGNPEGIDAMCLKVCGVCCGDGEGGVQPLCVLFCFV